MQNKPATLKQVFLFWVPLLTLFFVISLELPILIGIITYLPDEKINLAAFTTASAIIMFFESSNLMLNTITMKLVKDRHSYLQVAKFSIGLNTLVYMILAIFIATPLYWWITQDVLDLNSEIVYPCRIIMTILFVSSAWCCYKRFYQGILLASKNNNRLIFITSIRLIATLCITLLLAHLLSIPSAYIAALGYSISLIIESLLTRILSHQRVKEILATHSESHLSYRSIFLMYAPLSFTSIGSTMISPICVIFLNNSRNALVSLACFSIARSIILIFKYLAMSYQNVVIHFLGLTKENSNLLRRISYTKASIFLVILAIIVYTPIVNFILTEIYSVNEVLLPDTTMAMQILIFSPIISVLNVWQRSNIVNKKLTPRLTFTVFAELGIVIVSLTIFIFGFDYNGIISVAYSIVLGRICAVLGLTIANSVKQ